MRVKLGSDPRMREPVRVNGAHRPCTRRRAQGAQGGGGARAQRGSTASEVKQRRVKARYVVAQPLPPGTEGNP